MVPENVGERHLEVPLCRNYSLLAQHSTPRRARQVHKLATSRHAPADWMWHAQMVVASWAGQRTTQIASAMHCHPQTVRERLQAFNERGLEGLGIHPGAGRPPRLTQEERSRILDLVRHPPPGKLVREPDGGELQASDPTQPGEWTLDTLTGAAQAQGIQVARSQVRRIVLHEGMKWRHTHLWANESGPELCRKRTAVVTCYTQAPANVTTLCVDELGPVSARTYPPSPGWSPSGHHIKSPLEYSRGFDKAWAYGALAVSTGQTLTLTTSSRNTSWLFAVAGRHRSGLPAQRPPARRR